MSNEAPTDALLLVPVEPTPKMLKAAFAAMNATPSGEWKRMKAESKTPRELFDAKMRPRWSAMLAAAPASPLPGGGWQDISTAPKDGTIVDLFYPERGRLTDATWGPTGWGRHEWRGSHTVRMIPSEKPTHWMPLPAAPTGEPK